MLGNTLKGLACCYNGNQRKNGAIWKWAIYSCSVILVQLWSVAENKYKDISLTLDTGASVTTLTPEIFYALGYEPSSMPKKKLTTASDVTIVSHFSLDAIKIGNIELKNIDAYALKFPEESFSMGVIGLNVLRQFDVELLFSQHIVRLIKL